MWVGNDEYETRVNYCPMTGRPAKTQMAATESTSPYTDSAYAVTIHTIYKTPPKERYSEIIDEAYKNYCKYTSANDSKWNQWMRDNGDGTFSMFTQEEFINKIKTDDEISKRWGLKIEERELSVEERNEWFQINLNGNNPLMKSDWKDYELDQQNIPKRLITVTYSHEKIEVYEQ
jgi:hypothetical protein